MKNIEKKKLDQLLEIIDPAPALRLAHFSESGEEMVDYLSAFCQKNSYEYQINCTNQTFYTAISTKYTDIPDIKCINFSLSRPKYMLQGKLYDYIFVTSAIPDSEKGNFLMKTHDIIKNSGLILIFLPKDERAQRYEWISLLEEHYYVASSIIDDLFSNYDLLISKKMHGWGKQQ
jgi:hypothetical protein